MIPRMILPNTGYTVIYESGRTLVSAYFTDLDESLGWGVLILYSVIRRKP